MSSRPEIHYDDDTHTYTLGGRNLPSVTTVITSVINPFAFLSAPHHLLETGRRRGRIVHRLTERVDAGEIFDPADTHPLWMAFIKAHRRVVEKYGLRPIHFEQIVASIQYGYAGRIDRTYESTVLRKIVQVDIKTGEKNLATDVIQAAAYDWAAKEWLDFAPDTHWSEYLRLVNPDHNIVRENVHRHTPLELNKGFLQFVHALCTFNYRRTHSLKEMPVV